MKTFSSIIKKLAVRIILPLAAQFNWSLHKLDVKNVFLHGDLLEEIYMQQPQEFIDPLHPQYVCKPLKSLYALKQASRAWFNFFHHIFSHLALKHLQLIVLFLLGSIKAILPNLSSTLTTSLSQQHTLLTLHFLCHSFDYDLIWKIWGLYDTFLDWKYPTQLLGFFVYQAKYTRDILKRFGMKDCKTLLHPSIFIFFHWYGGSMYTRGFTQSYRALIGVLHYLTFTRHSVTFDVSKLSQFMHSACSGHLLVAKRILRYLNGTIGLGIFL